MRYFALFLTASLLLLGCIGGAQDTTQVVKALPQVQQFLQEHPAAEIKTVYLPAGSGNYSEIKRKCEVSLEEKDLWYASVKEGTVFIEVWLEGSTQRLLCAYKTPTATPEPTAAPTAAPTAVVEEDEEDEDAEEIAESGEFTFKDPAGWTKDESGKMGTMAIWFGPQKNGFTANINLVSEEIGEMSLEDYDALSIGNAPKVLTDYEVLDSGRKSVSGRQGKTYTFSFTQGKSKLKAKNVFFVAGGVAYTITYTNLAGRNFDAYVDVFDELVDSMEFASETEEAEDSESTINHVRDDAGLVRDKEVETAASATPITLGAASPTVQAAAATSTGTGDPNEAEAKSKCVSLCNEWKSEGNDLSNGPCLSYAIATGWVCDVAHSPRIAADDVQANQCPMTLPENPASHFVEVDEDCNLIKVV
ncbi:hypothetical protein HZC09_02755 [Candidatus Micrarchaeota archaeon]|nr:hypothetical protein [Candidatus Micrarchaeota archaeon]